MSDLGIHRVSSNPGIWDWGKEMIVMVGREMTVTTAIGTMVRKSNNNDEEVT